MTKRAPNTLPANTAIHTSMSDVTVDAGSAEHWVQLLPVGKFSGRNGLGPYILDAADMPRVVAASQQRAGSSDLVIDYDHQSVFSAIPGVGGNAPAAGWIKKLEARDDGLYGQVEWTERAASAIRAGEYRYISPVYHHDKAGRILRVLHAGLTNTPNLDLAAVAASDHLQQEETMDKIAVALGLAQGADENAVLTAINSLQTSAAAIATMAAAAGLAATASADDIVTAINSQRGAADPTKFVPIGALTALQDEVRTLKTSLADDKATTAVNSAIEAGKLIPAMRDWGLSLHRADPAAFTAFVDKAPVLTAAQSASAANPSRSDDPELTEADLAVMSQMGLGREAFLKAKKGAQA